MSSITWDILTPIKLVFYQKLNFTEHPVFYPATLLLTLEIFQFPFFNSLSTFKKCIEISTKVLFRLPLSFVGLCFIFILHYPLNEISGKEKSKCECADFNIEIEILSKNVKNIEWGYSHYKYFQNV